MSKFRDLMKHEDGDYIYGWHFKVNEEATGTLSDYFSTTGAIDLTKYNAWINDVPVTAATQTVPPNAEVKLQLKDASDRTTSYVSITSTFGYAKSQVYVSEILAPAPKTSTSSICRGMSSLKKIPSNFFKNNINASSLTNAFDGTAIEHVPKGLFNGMAMVTTASLVFANCNELKTIPKTLFYDLINNESFSYVFHNCESLEYIPEGLFDNNTKVTTFEHSFHSCRSIKSIPESLFYNCTKATNFGHAFNTCVSLESVPEDMFKNSTEATMFAGVFGYSGLKEIPVGLFRNNTKAERFDSAFSGTQISQIPADLFMNNVSALSFGLCFRSCNNLTEIPDGLFKYNINVSDVGGFTTGFYATFLACTSLTTIPSGLFSTNKKAGTIVGCFSGCSALTTVSADLLYGTGNITTASELFKNTGITEIPPGLLDPLTKCNNFSNCFNSCKALTTVPKNLFSKNKNAVDFGGCFRYCENITSALPEVWDTHPESATTTSRRRYYAQGCINASNYSSIPKCYISTTSC